MEKFPSRERADTTILEPRVSAVVVARGVGANDAARSALDLCLRSAIAEPWIDELVVVDQGNMPAVSSALRALQLDRRDVRLASAPLGASTAAAANMGAARANGRWLLFLDADVVLQRGAVSRLAAAGGGAATPWIVGGRLTGLDGRERRAARAGTLTTFSTIAVALGWHGRPPRPKRGADDAAGATRVGAVSGALMLIPRDDFQALGGFDEGFVSDGADLDICRRARDAGGSVIFQPDAGGVQFERLATGKRRQVQGLARFAEKSARTPLEKAFASIAAPALAVMLGLRDFIVGRPPVRR